MPSPGIANLLPQLNGTPILGEEARSSIQDILKRIIPGWAAIDAFYSSWLNLDLTTLAAVLTVFGTVGSAVRDLRDVSLKLYWWITTFFTASISINGNDRLNREVINWLGANVLTRQGTRILTASSETINNDSWSWRYRPVERTDYHHEKRLPVTYLPTFGTTWFIHKYRLFMVKRIPKTSAYRADMPEEFASAPRGDEPLVIMCLGRSVDPIKGFLDTCRSFADAQRESFTTVRAARSEYNMECWDTTILRPIRPIETVHFDEKLKAELVSDIRSYLDVSTRKFYNARGIPYRRGYLLHGPPGTGKTSLSLALAGHFGLDLYILHIPSVREDREVEKLFTALPPQCLILLEDIDAVGMKRRALKDADEADDSDSDGDDDDVAERLTHCRCTLSGLLNILDGVAAQEGRIVLMTSNVADSLDPALVRPGRIDRIIYLGEISRESARLMFLRMYDGEEDGVSVVRDKSGAELAALASEFAAGIAERYFTPAQVQGFLLRYRGDAVGAAREVRRWAEEEGRVMEEARAKSRRVAEARARRKERRKERRRARKAEDAERALALAERRKRKGAGAGGGDNEEANEEAEGEEEGQGEINGTKECKVNGEKKGEAENGEMTGREEEKKESGEKENGDKSEAVEAKENGET